MKKSTMILALVLMISMPLMAERVTPETAQKVAKTFLNNNGAKAVQLTDLSKAAGFANLYIFCAEEGFVVMSADDCVKPILGYSLTGKFVAEGMPENIASWLQGYNDEIQYAIDNRLNASSETTQQWDDLAAGKPNAAKTTTVVEPLIQTKWDQGEPYNNLCPPGTVTGCVATAMAQVMKYWNYPVHGISSHAYVPQNNPALGEQFADFNSTYYDWANMTNTYNSSSTVEQKAAVATLMYHCGVSVSMKYGPSSGAPTTEVAEALKNYFNYSSDVQFLSREDYTETEWVNMLKSDLDQNWPIQYSGSGSGGGHSFVCDGYNSDNYFHFNWGWGGSCDAYYSVNNLNPGPGGIGSGSYGVYNEDQGGVFGVRPSECTADAPTNLTYTQSERNVTFSWDAASGAVSYNLYHNSSFVGNSTTTSYTDVAPFGTAAYYVRSVDSDGELSLSSNSVNVTVDYQTPIVVDMEANLSGDNVNLSWTAPEWCFPETESSILTYGEGTPGHFLGYSGTANLYWGHRYLPTDLTEASGKVIFRVSFYIREIGTYELNIYTGTTTVTYSSGSYDIPTTLLTNKTITATQTGWFTIDLDEPVTIDTSQDLWIMMYDPESKQMPAEYCPFNEHERGGYITDDITSWTIGYSTLAFLIRTYLTDGSYTYNLYQDGIQIADNLSETNYNATLNNNAANLFTIKTHYNGGETTASNMAGFAKGSASLSDLEMNTNDKMMLTNGSQLTVSGTLSNTVPANLILENGAQLIHDSYGVKATVKKDIESYTTDDNGWNFIASPVTETITPSQENGFLNGTAESNTFDLYYYDEPNHLWVNYEYTPFNLTHQSSYLYANGEPDGTTLWFAGTLQPSNSTVSINSLSHSATTLNGFNLVGNPFVCNATINQDCFVIEGNHVILSEGTKVFAPCEGAFVKATSDEYAVTFTKSVGSKGNNLKDCLDLVVTQSKANVDRARVRFGEGTNLEKFTLEGDESSLLTLWQEGTEYAVVYADEIRELPMNFNATKDGTYTIGIETNNLELDYLHLIDNMTGMDVDLLATPSYTFEAKTTDYASRFKLLFSNGEDTVGNDETFAYYANGEIHLVKSCQGASLQIVDMTGRIVVCTDVACNVSANEIPSGVYVLRLITAEKVRTQKIVIE
jgi:hypothetical protein